jgi:hypothetical protein
VVAPWFGYEPQAVYYGGFFNIWEKRGENGIPGTYLLSPVQNTYRPDRVIVEGIQSEKYLVFHFRSVHGVCLQ